MRSSSRVWRKTHDAVVDLTPAEFDAEFRKYADR
jgi:hypothetical protein